MRTDSGDAFREKYVGRYAKSQSHNLFEGLMFGFDSTMFALRRRRIRGREEGFR